MRAATTLYQRIVAVGLLVVMAVGLNAHLVFLQLYGWSNMAFDYRDDTVSWTEAIDRALSGENSCNMCRTVELAMLARQYVDESAGVSAAPELMTLSCLFFVPVAKPANQVQPPALAGTIDPPGIGAFSVFHSQKSPPPRPVVC